MGRQVHRPLEDREFDFVLGMIEGPVLVHFTGSWPKAMETGRVMDALLAELAEEYGTRLTAVRADITRCPAATRRYEVTGAPTVLLLRGADEVVARHEGPLTREGFRAFLDAHVEPAS
ncbi:thioredoxin family protein [Streptomyces sp. RerS4]|uniref:thioredoxin family protein n=1 Tax=Streptomyces sp. RerS4 TaxID=2942449 RepID=UPI00201C9CEF|nr:thioredoxin family protein [Streptomyces sp. RerS4]UQW99756.1 thioredoxin family protein [Streptomyces sp. RerS4]